MSSLGQTISDLDFLQPDGIPIKLSELHSGPVVLIFLRHLA